MLDFLPLPIKAFIGISVIVFIGVQGFRLTSKDGGSKSTESSSSSSNKKEEPKKETKAEEPKKE